MILVFFGAHAWTEVDRKRGIAAFTDAQQLSSVTETSQPVPNSSTLPDDHQKTPSLTATPAADEVLAIIRVEAIGLELPVRYGTDEKVLRRGPGLIEGTARPGSNGNVSIAAHRDTHFRRLKDLALGDLIKLEIPGSHRIYIVTNLSIVEPTDIRVLEDTGHAVMTLVTCYPFHFVGNAPKRFIVRAEAAESMQLIQ